MSTQADTDRGTDEQPTFSKLPKRLWESDSAAEALEKWEGDE